MGDSVGGAATPEGLKRLVKLFEEHRPAAFLFWAMYGRGDTDKRQLSSVQAALRKCRDLAPGCVFFYGNGNQASTIVDGEPDFNVLAFESLIDVVLDNTMDSRIKAIYESRGFGFDTLHTFGFDPVDIPNFNGTPAEYDVFFGGSYTGQRRFPNSKFRHDLLTAMHREFVLEVRGRGKWPVPHKPYVHAMDYPKIIGRAKVALGCYHADLKRYYTKRTIYSLASGRPYVVRYIPGMEMDFKLGKEVVSYTTVPEAVEAVKKLLHNPSRAKAVGAAGRTRAVEDHSWEARLRDMGRILNRCV